MRMNDRTDPLGLNEVVFRHVDKGRVECKNGSVFICPLPGGSLRFLHKFYGYGERNQPAYLEHLFGFALPEDYLAFMRAWNGATLFDNSFCLDGLVPQLNRGLTLEDSQPISLETALKISHVMHDPGYPWRPFGSVAGYEKLFRLEFDASGRARMQWENGPARVANSVRDLVQPLAEFLGNLTDEHGFLDQTQRSMDAELSRFVELSR
jgi:hypothetical protein